MLDSADSRAGAARTNRFGPIEGVREGASSVLNDAFDLAELQGKLFLADGKECVQIAKVAILGLVVALGAANRFVARGGDRLGSVVVLGGSSGLCGFVNLQSA